MHGELCLWIILLNYYYSSDPLDLQIKYKRLEY